MQRLGKRREPKQRDQSQHHRRHQTQHDSERPDDTIEPDFLETRQVHWPDGDEELDGRPREGESDRAARQRQQRALGQEIVRDRSVASAERSTHGSLPPSELGTDQEEIGDIRARDQEHETDRCQQDPQGHGDFADGRIQQRRHHRDKHLVAVVRIRRVQVDGQLCELGARLGNRGTLAKP